MLSDAEMMMIGLRGETADPQTGLGLSSFASQFDRTERQLVGDVYLKGPFELLGQTHEAVIGASWAKLNAHWTSRDDAIALPTVPVGQFDGDFPRPDFADVTSTSDFTSYRRSLYGAGHFTLTDELKALVGANFTQLVSSGERVGEAHQYRKFKTTPYAGLIYDFADHYSAYVSYTEIFSPQYQIDTNRQLLEPIEGNSVEAGIKGEWFDGRLNASAALFRTRQDNTAEFDGFDVDGGFSYYQGVDTLAEGYELSLEGELAPGWQASAGLTHLFSLKDADGKAARTYTPQNVVYLNSVYRLASLPKLKVGASLIWQSDIERSQRPFTPSGEQMSSRQGAYAVVNAMARYDIDEHFDVGLNVNNVFDKKYLTSLYWEQAHYAAPRNAMVTLTWKY